MSGQLAKKNKCHAVTIVGAGIAGMSAALRLLDAGFDVTVLEKKDRIGGKFDAERKNRIYHEHAYHFLADWCLNFWKIVEDIHLSKDSFVRRDSIKFLWRRSAAPRRGSARGQYDFLELRHGGALFHFWDNIYSKLIPARDMIAYVYSLLDLVTGTDKDPDELELLNRNSVIGYMRTRHYMTDLAALLHQEALLKAFAVPSYETSVRSYRTFIKYFGRDTGGWILRGNAETHFWRPFRAKLESYNQRPGGPRFRLHTNTELTDVEVEQVGAKKRIGRIQVTRSKKSCWLDPEHLLLAVPYPAVFGIVENNPKLRESLPGLLKLRKLRSRQMASLDLYFPTALPGIPAEHVTLIDDHGYRNLGLADRRAFLARSGDIASRFGLSFVDNCQAWRVHKPPKETWLNVVSADFDELSGWPEIAARDAIIAELRHYLDFDKNDIDWKRSSFRSNVDAPLFMNTVGSWQFRPETRTDPACEQDWVHKTVENLFLAGDYCRSKIDLVCLEGAVTTGISAARAIAKHCGVEHKVPEPLVPPEVDRDRCEAAKAILAPFLATGHSRRRRREQRV